MNNIIFLIILFFFVIFYFTLGYLSSRKTKNTTDYFLAGRQLGLLSVTFTLIASQLGGGMLLGTSQKAYDIGLFGILYTLSISIGFLILGFGFAAKLQSLNISTVPQLFETKFNSITLRKFASMLSILTLTGLFIGQIIASKTVFTSIGITSEIAFLIFWLLIISYTIIGGLNAIVWTDIAQVSLIILTFGGLLIYNLITQPNSFYEIFDFTLKNKDLILNKESIFSLIPILIIPALFTLIEQDLAQKFFASKSKKVAAMSAIMAGIFILLFSLIPIYFGVQARILAIENADQTSPLISALKFNTSSFIFILSVCAILAAISSTADSLLCAISSNLAQDFDLSFLKIKNKLMLAKYISAFVGLISIFLSYLFTCDIINILVSSYELSVCCLFIPLLLCTYLKKINKYSGYFSVVFGGVSYLILYLLNVPLYNLISIIFSLIGFYIPLMKTEK